MAKAASTEESAADCFSECALVAGSCVAGRDMVLMVLGTSPLPH
jgi:hypothetical protein